MSNQPKPHPSGLPISTRTKAEIFSAAVYDKRLSAGSFRDWHYFLDHANGKSQCWPSRRTMAKDLGANKDALQRQVVDLVTHGYLTHPRPEPGKYLVYTVLDGEGKVFPKAGPVTVPGTGNTFKRPRKRERSVPGTGINPFPEPGTEVRNSTKEGGNRSSFLSDPLPGADAPFPAFAKASGEAPAPYPNQNTNTPPFLKKGLD